MRRVVASTLARGGSAREKAASMGEIGRRLVRTRGDRRGVEADPLRRMRGRLDRDEVERVDADAAQEMAGILERALEPVPAEAGP
jgi:hypothetical protein